MVYRSHRQFVCKYSHSSNTMAASTSAKQEPAQPPSTNPPLPMDSKNDFMANDESAPLLDTDDMAPSNCDASNKLIYIFTSTALSSSALTLISIIASIIALNVGEKHYGLPWGVSESMVSIIAPVLIPRTPPSLCSMCSPCFRPNSRLSFRVSQCGAMALV